MDFPATHKAPIQCLDVEELDTGEYGPSSVSIQHKRAACIQGIRGT
jgi:hypothetical protein